MSIKDLGMAKIQSLGKSILLPIGLLSTLGILIAINSILKIPTLGGIVWAIFGNIPVIFAISVAFGLSKNEGVAGLSGFLIYFISAKVSGDITGATEILAHGGELARRFTTVLGQTTLSTGVFGGIFSGIIGSIAYHYGHKTKFISILAFYEGNRFVPILACFFGVLWGYIIAIIWPLIQTGISSLTVISELSAPISVFLFGVGERLLLPLGLHHIVLPVFFYEIGEYTAKSGDLIRGDYNIYIAMLQDQVFNFTSPNVGEYADAGKYHAGFFAPKMFGLAGATLAFYQAAKPENKKYALGIYGSAAFTAFLTGITEPLEFTFLFTAPLLYGIHALFLGLSFVIAYFLGIHLVGDGVVSFISFGIIPGLSGFETGWYKIPFVGAGFFILYYITFKTLLSRFSWVVPGREDTIANISDDSFHQQAQKIIQAIGGIQNIKVADACITRLRLEVTDMNKVNQEELKKLGAKGVIPLGETYLQAIFGVNSQFIAEEIRNIMSQ
ncbi:MAG: PTS transporter subunit EIIC [Brevinema sp.]